MIKEIMWVFLSVFFISREFSIIASRYLLLNIWSEFWSWWQFSVARSSTSLAMLRIIWYPPQFCPKHSQLLLPNFHTKPICFVQRYSFHTTDIFSDNNYRGGGGIIIRITVLIQWCFFRMSNSVFWKWDAQIDPLIIYQDNWGNYQ